jgi:hypothetical protein
MDRQVRKKLAPDPFPDNDHADPVPDNNHADPVPDNNHADPFPDNDHADPVPDNNHADPAPNNNHADPELWPRKVHAWQPSAVSSCKAENSVSIGNSFVCFVSF